MVAYKGVLRQQQTARIIASNHRLRPSEQVSLRLCNALLPLVAMGTAGMWSKVAKTPLIMRVLRIMRGLRGKCKAADRGDFRYEF